MEASFPTVEAIREIESRQDEVLRKLDELEAQIAAALVAFGDPRLINAAGASAPAEIPLVKAA